MTKRTLTAVASLIAGMVLLAGCSPTPAPTTSATPAASTTPTPTATPVGPPASEADAIAAAEIVITRLLTAYSEIGGKGGTDTAPLKELATGSALDQELVSANRKLNGPLLNEDNVSVDGPSTTKGTITYEKIAAYGQENQGVPNGLVTVNLCKDLSNYFITTADGKPALRPQSLRNKFDYQVTYDSERKSWLVSNEVDLGQSC